jgi:hypothetical protein
MAYFSLKYISCYGALNCYSFSELLQLECLTLNTVFGLFLISNTIIIIALQKCTVNKIYDNMCQHTDVFRHLLTLTLTQLSLC